MHSVGIISVAWEISGKDSLDIHRDFIIYFVSGTPLRRGIFFILFKLFFLLKEVYAFRFLLFFSAPKAWISDISDSLNIPLSNIFCNISF